MASARLAQLPHMVDHKSAEQGCENNKQIAADTNKLLHFESTRPLAASDVLRGKCWHISLVALIECRVLQQTSEHIGKNTSMPVIIYLDWSVDPQDHFESLRTTILPADS
jgi:hypothetical protein